MQIDLATLKQRIVEATQASSIGKQVEEIVLEPDRDDSGTDFLRVVIRVRHEDNPKYEELEALLEAIEETVGAVDERYPSVRFSDAA
jgi:uncharacterized protein (UPF0335 family)